MQIVTTELKVLEDRPVTPRSRAVRTTRRLLRNQEQAQAKTHNEPAVNVTAQLAEDAHIGGLADSGDSDVLREQKSLAIEKSNASPSKAREPTSPAVLTAASIEAIDALEEAVEEVAMSIPNLSLSPEKMCRAKGSPNPAQGDGSSSEESDRPIAPALKKSSAPKAPKSAKEAKKPVATAKRVTAPATRPALSRSASVRTASWKGGTAQGKSNVESTDYLATKRRPISMSFPAPPAPAKSANAPTKPTFQLPGEAVAARLKAQREERLKKEEEEAQKKREFKARPVPRTSIAPVTVKQTAASRARQSLIFNGSEMQGLSISENAQPLRRASSINAGSVANATAKRQSSITSKRSSVIMPPPAVAKPSANTSRPRVSASASSLSASSLSAAAPAATKSAVTAAEVAVQRVKAREIFNRDRVEKERRERERREKEEAAKRARAQAAERGRLASREWAEKQKARKVAVVPLVGGAGARAGAAGAAAAEVEAAPSAA